MTAIHKAAMAALLLVRYAWHCHKSTRGVLLRFVRPFIVKIAALYLTRSYVAIRAQVILAIATLSFGRFQLY